MNPIHSVGETAQQLLDPIAGALESVAGEAAWGLAIVLVTVAWQLPLAPWVVRSSRAALVRARVVDRLAGLDGRPPDRRSRARQVEREVAARGLRTTSDRFVGRLRLALGVTLALLVISWSRGGEAAAGNGFAGLRDLRSGPLWSGAGGVAWAVALAAVATANRLWVLHVATVRDERERFFGKFLTPLIFLGLGLFLPGGSVVALTAGTVLAGAATVAASRGSRDAEEDQRCARELISS